MSKPVTIHLRIPHTVYQAIEKVASTDRRSINTTVNILIEKGLPDGLLDETVADLAEATLGAKP